LFRARPRTLLQEAYRLQPLVNRLTDGVARDHEFLATALAHTRAADPFTGRLWDVYETARAAKPGHYEASNLRPSISPSYLPPRAAAWHLQPAQPYIGVHPQPYTGVCTRPYKEVHNSKPSIHLFKAVVACRSGTPLSTCSAQRAAGKTLALWA